MFNFEDELAKYNLTQEKYEQLLNDIDAKLYGKNDYDWSELHDKYSVKCNPDTIRKGSSTIFGGKFRSDYEKYLYKQVETEEKINQNFNIGHKIDHKIDMEYLLNSVTDDVIKLPLEQKRQMLIKDESFETIRSISNNAFEMAQEAHAGKINNIDETKVDEMKKTLNESLKSVKAFNKQQAVWLVSEGILDLNFVKNPKTDIMSIRLGRCLQST